MPRFPHLPIAKKIEGVHKPKQVPRISVVNPTTQSNLDNRVVHGNGLLSTVDALSNAWKDSLSARQQQNLPELPNHDIIPIFLQVDSSKFDIESLKSFGIEVIAEEEDGFIIGAAGENFQSLRQKIQNFIQRKGNSKDQASQLWKINDGVQWRIEQILTEELQAKWSSINDTDIMVVDVGIACHLKISKQPVKKKNESIQKFRERTQRWESKKNNLAFERDEIAIRRHTEFERLVQAYNGELLDGYVDFEDSFSCRIRISGVGLKDIVLNYQYLFEVIEYDPLMVPEGLTGEFEAIEPELIAPLSTDPKVCVIDSGIQQEHRLLAPAIDTSTSKSFVPGDALTNDIAVNGGHGTRVAGAVLYPNRIPRTGSYRLPCFIQNARVLIAHNGMALLPENLYPPKLMEDIVASFEGTRIFNMSINASAACRLIHMSQWAAAIDKIMLEKNVLFILSAGNLYRESNNNLKPGIKEHLHSGRNYPAFLYENSSRLANPAQSCFALVVGSICSEKFDDGLKESFGAKDEPSPFSRTGLGLWGMIKPDVVEYAGDFVREKNATPNISNEASISPELVRSTSSGGYGIGNDAVGTSFAAPKVAHIAAMLQKIYPTESANLYRALIAQSARLPENVFANPKMNDIRHYGYGIPSLQRATENSEKRITLIASDELTAKQATIYSLKVPSQMRRPGEDYDILIEVTLSFFAQPRRTRRRTQSYLSSWLNWESSKLNESLNQFKNRILKNMDSEESGEEDQNTIKWVIRERKDWSRIDGIRRQDSTLQKSWCILKSNQLPEVLNLAVIGHNGWEADLSEKIPYSLTISFEALTGNINVYEMMRVENEIPLPEIEQEITS